MSHEIIRQPNGLFAVWSTIVDDFVMVDATPEDIIVDELEDAKERISKEITDIVNVLNSGKPYMHFRSWKQAQKDRRFYHKDDK